MVKERGPGEIVRMRESERASRGSRGVLRATGRQEGRQEVAGAWPAHGEHAPLPSGARREMTAVASQLGRLVGPEQVGRQVRPGTIPFLSFILFLFSIF